MCTQACLKTPISGLFAYCSLYLSHLEAHSLAFSSSVGLGSIIRFLWCLIIPCIIRTLQKCFKLFVVSFFFRASNTVQQTMLWQHHTYSLPSQTEIGQGFDLVAVVDYVHIYQVSRWFSLYPQGNTNYKDWPPLEWWFIYFTETFKRGKRPYYVASETLFICLNKGHKINCWFHCEEQLERHTQLCTLNMHTVI